jgi:hypothetical protein
MANVRRELPVKKGRTAPARRAPGFESTAAKPTDEQLDAKQARMRLRRRRGPELAPAQESAARFESQRQVPPTECDEQGEE